MELQEIIKALPNSYSPDAENTLISKIKAMQFNTLTVDLADLLAFAISEHYNRLAKEILEKDYNGKKLNIQNINTSIINQSKEKYSLLHFTAQFGNKEMLLYFLNNNVEISLDKDNLSPLHTLTFAKNLTKADIKEILEKIKTLSPNLINQKDVFNLAPLHYAAHNNNMPALEALVECGAKK